MSWLVDVRGANFSGGYGKFPLERVGYGLGGCNET